MSKNWLGRAELKYNQASETIFVKILIDYRRGNERLMGNIDYADLILSLPDGVSTEDFSFVINGSPDNKKVVYTGCGPAQAADISTSKSDFMGGGIGLGLTLAKQVIESHDGQIVVESEPQKGSIFTVVLPYKN